MACDDYKSLVLHLYGIHLIQAGEQHHYQIWYDSVAPYCTESDVFLWPWLAWCARHDAPQVVCDVCGNVSNTIGQRNKMDHHLSMQAAPAQIKPYRREILRLCPDFAWHPIWNDLA